MKTEPEKVKKEPDLAKVGYLGHYKWQVFGMLNKQWYFSFIICWLIMSLLYTDQICHPKKAVLTAQKIEAIAGQRTDAIFSHKTNAVLAAHNKAHLKDIKSIQEDAS